MHGAPYLKRIHYRGSTAATADSLRHLQVAHLLTVPFENLSIHHGEEIVLDEDALFDKIVRRRRGGFCYEANGLFAALLRELGFDVAMVSAAVARGDGEFGPEFDHMTLKVTLDECWLVDVGFGDSFREPLLFDERGEQQQGSRTYRITAEGTHLLLSQRDEGDDWKPQYRFTEQPHSFVDFAEMCRYHQTSPLSHFTQAPVCSLATEDGRMTLSGMRLITTSAGKARIERTLATQDEYADVLREQFGIRLAEAVVTSPSAAGLGEALGTERHRSTAP